MHRIAFLLVNLALLIVANNINPGGRSHGGSWTDSDSNIWTFGGWGFDASGQEGFLNDLWMFSPSNNSWHWINGSQSISALGVYTGPNAFPGARESPMIWITPDRRTVYMFGGYGFAETGPLGYLQDMWRFDIATRVWTWIKGPRDTTNGPSNTAATPDAIPSGRYRSSAWTYRSTSLYLFGGAEAGGNLNDVWWFDIPSNTWAFIGGTTALNWYGTYGTTESTSNIPGGRVMTATWKDKDNMFWLYGGAGYASVNGQLGYLSDVWRFNPQTRGWTFIAGSATVNTPGNYGVFGVSSGGIPPPRLSSMGWFDSDSNEVVIFGGSSGESNGQTIAVQNDVWRFRPSTKEFIWVGGDPTPDQLGRFGEIGVPSKYNIPSARVASYIGQSGDNAYLFGGAHVYHNRPGTIVRLNDMWHLHLPTNIWTWLDGTNLPNQRTIYEAPDFNILSLPEYLSGNIHIEDIFTHEKWAGSFIKNSAGSNWNVSSVITNQEKRASLIYANGALVLREENSETTACFDPSEVLSDDVVGAAVKKAKQLLDNEIKDPTVLECVGTKWEVNVLQELYVVCRENATSNWKIFGINFVATLTDLVTSPFQSRKRNVELDSSLFSNLFNCSKADNEVPPFVEAVKWYARDWRNVENKNFECIFLHGEGMDHQTFSTSNNPTAYWSNIGDFTPQCTSKKFVEIDTLKRGWTDTSLQQDFCQVITGNRTGGEAQNKLIFAHSMGNLVLGAAIKNNYCTLGDSAYWYNIQGPNKGTQIAAFMAKACSEEGYNAPITEWLVKAALELEGINYTPGTLASALRLALGVGGYCNLNTFQLYPAYTTLIPTATNSQEFDSILETIQNNVHGGMCGTSAIGLASFNSIPSQLWHSLSAWDKSVGSTDGFVPLDSCKVFTKDFGKFSASYTNSHYLARVNNFDGRCIRSDGWWGVDRKPCLWYANQGLTETAYQPPTTVSSGYVVCPTLAGAGLLLVILGL